MKKKILERRKKLLEILWFIIKFNLLAIPMYVILYLNISLVPAQIFLTRAVEQTLLAFGNRVTTESYFLTLFTSDAIVKIEMGMDCLGWKTIYCLAALTIAVNYPLEKKIKFLLLALPFMVLLNFIRIITTILFSLKFGFQYLDIVHTLLWREGLIMAVIILWYIWLRKENIIKKQTLV